ncbi:hypothetical protein F5Y15DRAFT_416759 [Xylariaceae sp. FL0016]|nr:hypothetical protein F5Y15DRAFT_416759 [Xylariaceae sp. FL0016]
MDPKASSGPGPTVTVTSSDVSPRKQRGSVRTASTASSATTTSTSSSSSSCSSIKNRGQYDGTAWPARVWRMWQHPKTRVGRAVAVLFSAEALVVLLPMSRVAAGSDGVTQVYGRAPYLYSLPLQILLVLVLFSIGALQPTGTWHVPPVPYATCLLQSLQGRAGARRRKVVLGAKVLNVVVSGALLWVWSRVPGVHRSHLAADWGLVPGLGQHRELTLQTVLGYIVLAFDAVAMVWGYGATAVMAFATGMGFCACFAWSATPDAYSIAELRALVKAEEARRAWWDEVAVLEPDEGCEGGLGAMREWWAGLGERMMGWAGRQC